MGPLLNKPYVNGVTLRVENLSLQCCQSLDQKLCTDMPLPPFDQQRSTIPLWKDIDPIVNIHSVLR